MLRDSEERVFCLVNTIKIRPSFYDIQSRTESKSIYKAKYVTSEVRARIVCVRHCYKHEKQSAGGRNDSKSTIPAWDATCLSQKRSGWFYCQNMHPQLLTYLT